MKYSCNDASSKITIDQIATVQKQKAHLVLSVNFNFLTYTAFTVVL